MVNTRVRGCWTSLQRCSISRDTKFLRPCKAARWWQGWRRSLHLAALVRGRSRSFMTASQAWGTFRPYSAWTCRAKARLPEVGSLFARVNSCPSRFHLVRLLLFLLLAKKTGDRVHDVLTVLSAGHLRYQPVAYLAAEHSF